MAEAGAKAEAAEAEGDEAEEEEGEVGKEEDDKKETVWSLIKNSGAMQITNFIMIFLVWSAQIVKYGYDASAKSYTREIVKDEDYIDFTGLSLFNNIIMMVDSIVVCMDAISLLKYTSLLLPSIEAVMFTFAKFITDTFRKTILFIGLLYICFGMVCQYILGLYQYGFFW